MFELLQNNKFVLIGNGYEPCNKNCLVPCKGSSTYEESDGTKVIYCKPSKKENKGGR